MKKILTFLFVGLIAFFTTLNAQETVEPKVHKVVIQVSTDDMRTQKIALNNAVNLQKLYGLDNVEIEIVAFGPGITLLTDKSRQVKRVESLALQDISFSACLNSIEKLESVSGSKVELLEGVGTVRAGVARIIELQEDGYSYIRP